MKSLLYIILISFAMLFASCQKKRTVSILDFGFENVKNGKPIGWSFPQGKDYVTYLDSVNMHSGKYSAVIEFYDEGSFGFSAISIELPDNYEGKEITLSGYLKTEDVTEGYAGLWMRIDPKIAFDNMDQRGITGTTEWEKYEITLPLNPSKTKKIVLGALLTGNGKVWVDDLHITIDGKEIMK